MELLYQNAINPLDNELIDTIKENMDLKDDDRNNLDLNYISNILKLISENQEAITAIIEQNLEGWAINRVSKVNLSILKIAIAEIKYMDDIPNKVSINEALNLTEKYGDIKDKPFINSVLDNVLKQA